jgi:Spy/CpxP family protein refolding chaperone
VAAPRGFNIGRNRAIVRAVKTLRPLPLACFAALLLAGCKDKPADPAPPIASQTAAVSASAVPVVTPSASAESRPRTHGNGPAFTVLRAAGDLALTPEQKAKVEAAEKTLQEGEGTPKDHEDFKAASKELQAELAAGVRAGKLDLAKIGPKVTAMEQISKARHDRQATAVKAAHEALEPAQRKQLAETLRAKQAKEFVEKETDATARRSRGRTAQFTRGLDLTPEQKTKIDAIAAKDDSSGLTKREETKKRWEEFLSAFEKDTLDTSKVELFGGKASRAAVEGDALLLADIAPVLTADQREKLAGHLDRAAQHGGPGGPGGPGGRKTLRDRMGPGHQGGGENHP